VLDSHCLACEISQVPDYTNAGTNAVDLPDVPGVRHRFITTEGVRLHVAEAGEDDAAPVLLLHGFPQHWYMWRDMILSLARTKRVIAPDLRGFGWSDAPKRGYSTPRRVADVLAILDDLDVAKVDVVGHDWGAWLGFRLALDHPDRVNRLVAISMVHPWVMQRHLIPNLWRWWVTAPFEMPGLGGWVLRRRPNLTMWLMARDSTNPPGWARERHQMYAVSISEPARAGAGRRLHSQLVMRDIPRLLLGRDRSRRLDAQTLIIGGDDDALLPPRVLTPPPRLADQLEVRTIPGGHFLVDDNPERVFALVNCHLH
jgi:pimeloyl-ACP methyl ester carboxylesterase